MSFKKEYLKKTPEKPQEYLKFKKRGFLVLSKKGKSPYKRKNKYNKINNLDY